ncbi:MAG: SDR family oxidoreductase, partial [Lachnospiraceae bacterium]|nr:SDR family oxidoreductase [Lachnospiraceae bacterium]
NLAKTDYQKSGFAYALSKSFVVWYAQKCAFEYGQKGIRVCSLSPGLIATVADERNGYLAGVDVLVDGGSTNGKNFRK